MEDRHRGSLQKHTHPSQVPVIDRLDPEDSYDYILVVIRKNQVPDLLPVLASTGLPMSFSMVNNPSARMNLPRHLVRSGHAGLCVSAGESAMEA